MSSATRHAVGLLGCALAGLILVACSPVADHRFRPAPRRPSRRHPRPRPPPHRRQPLASQPSRRPLTPLPPPPPPSGPAPSTAGGLSDRSLPIPSGWRTAVLDGGDEEGFRGNGTWVHARDPSLRRTRCDRPRLCRRHTRRLHRPRGSPRGQLPKSIRRRRDRPGTGISTTSRPRVITSSSTAGRSSPAPQEMNPYTPRLCRASAGWSTAVPTRTASGPRSPNGTAAGSR